MANAKKNSSVKRKYTKKADKVSVSKVAVESVLEDVSNCNEAEEKSCEAVKKEKKINVNVNTLFGSIGTVEKPDVAYGLMQALSGEKNIDIDDVNAYASAMGKLYFRESGRDISEQSNAETIARYMLVDTGLKNKVDNENIYASFIKTRFGWNGAYIGVYSKLYDRMLSFYAAATSKNSNDSNDSNDDSECVNDGVVTIEDTYADGSATEYSDDKLKEYEYLAGDDMLKQLFDMLMKKEIWNIARTDGSNRLGNYLLAVKSKVKQLMKSNCYNGYIVNEKASKVVFNSGLFDSYMKDIYIMCDIYNNESGIGLCGDKVVENKMQLVANGFNRNELKNMPEPVKFFACASDLVMNADIGDFDIDNRARIDHVIEERLYRFPEKWQSASKDEIYDKIERAVENSLRMQSRDYKYVVPMYNIERDEIQYLMPLHLDKKIDSIPELVMIIAKSSDFYNLMTIISTSDAYDNARVIASLDSKWLSIEK